MGNTPERLIILFDREVYPPIGGTVIRASGFADIYSPVAEVAQEKNLDEVVVAGSYHDVISVSSLFPKPQTVVVSLLTTSTSFQELGRQLYDLAQESSLVYFLRFPPQLVQGIRLARGVGNFLELVQKMNYDHELIHHLLGVQPEVVLSIAAVHSNQQS